MEKVLLLALFAYFVLRSLWDLHSSSEAKRNRGRRFEVPFERDSEVDKYFRSHGIDGDADKAEFVRRAATAAAFEENKKDRE